MKMCAHKMIIIHNCVILCTGTGRPVHFFIHFSVGEENELFLRVGGREKIIFYVKYRLWLRAHLSKVGNNCQILKYFNLPFC